MPDKGIILYDFMAVEGGAEKLTRTLLDEWTEVDFCTAFINRQLFRRLGSANGQVFNLAVRAKTPPWRILKAIHAFESDCRQLDAYDWALFSGICAPMAVKNRSKGRNYLYCHTIPRFCFDLRDHYMGKMPWFARPALAALIRYVSGKYRAALGAMDIVIANSENVRGRLLRYFSRDAVVVNPPVDTDRFRWITAGDYYVSLARLEDFKRVDLIVRAFMSMPNKRLVVASGGSEFGSLKRLAATAPNIEFAGWLPEDELRNLIGNARAAIYVPIDEDFGISPVEAMAAGKPVIGVAEGGLLETIVDGETGLLIHGDLIPESIVQAVGRLETIQSPAMRQQCERQAQRFSREVFIKNMREAIGVSG